MEKDFGGKGRSGKEPTNTSIYTGEDFRVKKRAIARIRGSWAKA